MSGDPAKRVLIVCQLDRFASGVKPIEVERYLRGRGHEVRRVDTCYLTRASRAPGSLGSRLPYPERRHALLYAVQAAGRAISLHPGLTSCI